MVLQRGGATSLADATSEAAAQVIGGVAYAFDQEERAEKLRAAVSALGSTNPPDASLVKLDAVVKEVLSVRPRSASASSAERMVIARAPAC